MEAALFSWTAVFFGRVENSQKHPRSFTQRCTIQASVGHVVSIQVEWVQMLLGNMHTLDATWIGTLSRLSQARIAAETLWRMLQVVQIFGESYDT